MEKKLSLTWNIYNNDIDSEERYCHNCGEKVIFKDSLKRRQNANDKNIYYYAIYKCPKGHTWNKKINEFKTTPGLENNDQKYNINESSYDDINLNNLMENTIDEVEIFLNQLHQKTRLDKLLSSRITDVSRTKIIKLIDSGLIIINGNKVKSNLRLKEKDIITLLVGSMDKEELCC